MLQKKPDTAIIYYYIRPIGLYTTYTIINENSCKSLQCYSLAKQDGDATNTHLFTSTAQIHEYSYIHNHM